MRLSQFILSNLEQILTEWESFASTVLPGKQFDKAMLRNDAAEILETIATDMETPQTAAQQTVKPKVAAPRQHRIPLRKGIVMFDWDKALTRCRRYLSSALFALPSFGSG